MKDMDDMLTRVESAVDSLVTTINDLASILSGYDFITTVVTDRIDKRILYENQSLLVQSYIQLRIKQ